MVGHGPQAAVGWVSRHPCAWLFGGLVLLLVALPYVGGSVMGQIAGAALHDIILIASVIVLSRSRRAFVLAALLAAPAMGIQFAAIYLEEPRLFVWTWGFSTVFYIVTLGYLLRYVLSAESMNADKLYGAAAAYMMLGALWYYAYNIVQYFVPGSFAVHGVPAEMLTRFELIYFSYTVLTSTGFGDIAALSPQARSLANLESICGILFVAILVARLVGIYPNAGKE